MKTLIAASLLALSVGAAASTAARAEDVGGDIARGVARGLTDNYGRGYDRPHRWERDRYEGRSAYGEGCRTIIVRRETPDGDVTKRIRRCD